ncbi:MAG: hypothetical protein HRU26_11190 [Psychroserpens sp.]|nr:hypothetical protein [Psychroserpens sp.]
MALVTYAQGQTQPDNSQRSIKIPAVESKEKDSVPTPKPVKIEPKKDQNDIKKNNSGINYPVKVRELKSEKREFSMFDDNKLRDPGEIFEKRYNKQMEDQGVRIKTMPDMFLGDVRVRGEIANIRCRDHEFPDGDLVRIMVNDEIFIPQLLLTGNFKSFDIPLKEGINSVVFIALNQGDSGPNTAEFEVYDDNKVLVSSKRWNLLTGVKATILVIKDSSMPQLKSAANQNSEEEN